MKVIHYQKSYSSNQLKKIGTYACVILFLVILGILAYLFLIEFQTKLSLATRFILLLFSYLTISVLYYFSFHGWHNHKTYLDQFINNLVGGKGEKQVSLILEKAFDDTCIYIRNCSIPKEFKGGGDIDGILVTPKGLFILEVKFYSANYEIDNGRFYKSTKACRSNLGFDRPMWQANKQKEYITKLLDRNGYHIHIRSLIVLAHGHIIKIVGHTGVYVLELDKLIDFIKNEMLSVPTQLDDAMRDQLVCLLTNNGLDY